MDKLQTRALDALLRAMRANSKSEREAALRDADDLLQAAKVLEMVPTPLTPPRWWQSEWIWRAIIALISALLGTQVKF